MKRKAFSNLLLLLLLPGLGFAQVNQQHKTHHHPIRHSKTISCSQHTSGKASSSCHSKQLKKKPQQLLPEPIAAKTEQSSLPAPQIKWANNYLVDRSLYYAHTTEKNLAALADYTLNSIRYTAYKLGGTNFNPQHGVYVVDCSEYVDQLLTQANPVAFDTLSNWSGTEKPTSNDYFSFFNQLNERPLQNWQHVDNVSQLKPGDILVFRFKNDRHHRAYGHVMVVMNEPTRDENWANLYYVRVSDSAPSGHSDDTRNGHHHSGIGAGTIVLQVDSQTGNPIAYAWRTDAPLEHNMYYAMARPVS